MVPYLLTSLAMIAFAANTVICRLALIEYNGEASIDPASFTSIRLISGALTLIVLMLIRTSEFKPAHIKPLSALMLFTYAICFSFSYVNISTGTGALILFGSVQLTMIIFGFIKGERLSLLAWTGIILAFSGLIYLLFPGISSPPITNAGLMIVAGLAWGVYSLQGKGIKTPLIATGWNFIGTLPMVMITYLVFHADAHLTQKGILLAVLSGAVASGIGYAIWYSALPYLTATRAATVQLTVPIIAAVSGVIFLSEQISLRLILASIAILGGVYLTIKTAKS